MRNQGFTKNEKLMENKGVSRDPLSLFTSELYTIPSLSLHVPRFPPGPAPVLCLQLSKHWQFLTLRRLQDTSDGPYPTVTLHHLEPPIPCSFLLKFQSHIAEALTADLTPNVPSYLRSERHVSEIPY